MRVSRTVLLAAGMLALASCAKKSPNELPPPPATGAQDDPFATGQDAGDLDGSHARFLAEVGVDRIFFDTDQSTIDAQDQATLQRHAQWLSANPGARATIEGHCDERGTREYNLALGERRANAAKNYLVSRGIDPARISVISYGKERPEELGSDDGAWAQNRRAVTVIVG